MRARWVGVGNDRTAGGARQEQATPEAGAPPAATAAERFKLLGILISRLPPSDRIHTHTAKLSAIPEANTHTP